MPDVHVRLLVSDLAAVTDFYRDALGLRTRLEVGGVYAELEADDGGILGIYARERMVEALDGAPLGSGPVTDCAVVVIGVDDVDETIDRLEGVEVVAPPTDRPDWFLRTAHVRDPDGNLVEVNAPL